MDGTSRKMTSLDKAIQQELLRPVYQRQPFRAASLGCCRVVTLGEPKGKADEYQTWGKISKQQVHEKECGCGVRYF